MRRTRRVPRSLAILAACVAAAATADFVLVIAIVAHGVISGTKGWVGFAFVVAVFSFPAALLIALVIGTPLVLRHGVRGAHRRRAAAWSGAVIGVMLPLVMWAVADPVAGARPIAALGVTGVASLAGLAAGIVWDAVLTALELPPAPGLGQQQ